MSLILKWGKLPFVLALILYLLIFFIRYQQGGWDIELDLFPEFRQSLDHRISQLLPSPQAELLSGILLGNKKTLPAELKLALRDTSTLHMVVVSGQNLSMVAGFFLLLSGLIKRRIAIAFSLLAIFLYTLLTGVQVPVLRAAVMAILAFYAEAVGRQRDGIWVLIVTAGLMLLINPNWTLDLSFQLSFLATLGIITVAPPLERVLKFLPTFLRQDLAVTTGAQLLVMPIIIQNFHQLSIVGVLANLLVGWTIPFIMVLGALMLVLGGVVSLLVSAFLTYYIYAVQFFASFPFAWEYVGEQVWAVWVGYYLVLGGVLVALSRANKLESRV